MDWRSKLGLPQAYPPQRHKSKSSSWDRIPDTVNDLTNPKFANTGSDWDSLSDEVLQCYAQTETQLRPQHEAGTLPGPAITPHGVVNGVNFAPYDGAGEAWQARVASYNKIPLTMDDNWTRQVLEKAQELVPKNTPINVQRWFDQIPHYYQRLTKNYMNLKNEKLEKISWHKALSPTTQMARIIAIDAILTNRLRNSLKLTKEITDTISIDYFDEDTLELQVNQSALAHALLAMPEAEATNVRCKLIVYLKMIGFTDCAETGHKNARRAEERIWTDTGDLPATSKDTNHCWFRLARCEGVSDNYASDGYEAPWKMEGNKRYTINEPQMLAEAEENIERLKSDIRAKKLLAYLESPTASGSSPVR